MEQVSIDLAKCTGCGVCAAICPYRAIAMTDGRAEHDGQTCFLCGHCLAVCPAEAIDVAGLSPRRRYRESPVPLATLEDLVKIGTTAPSGTNSQGWNFGILPNRENVLAFGSMVADYYRRLNRLAANPLLRGLVRVVGGDSLGRYHRNYFHSVAEALRQWDEEGIDRLFHGATAAILVSGRRQASCPAEDCLLATQNILLAAHALGLGSCLIGFAVAAVRRAPALRTAMMIPADEELYSVVALGWPAVSYHRPAGRRPVRPRIIGLAGK
jgi:nitroreductase/NAD-dependent dihydropyrimidine dehydrogenase PreA subunit